MNHTEIEVKFNLNTIKHIQDQLLQIGAVSNGRVFEENIRFDNKNNSLLNTKSLLRLRKDTKTTLTYKLKTPGENRQFKIHQEMEVEISDFETMNSILESIGFCGKQLYEKWRETYIINKTTLCIDQMPFGDFLEIEGEMEGIRQVADALSLSWNKRILLNYIELFEILKQDLKLKFNDITFDNFKDIHVDLAKYKEVFEAG